jgi:hypothetical protein
MEAARTSETSVDIQLRTRRYIPEDTELHSTQLSADLSLVCNMFLSEMLHVDIYITRTHCNIIELFTDNK